MDSYQKESSENCLKNISLILKLQERIRDISYKYEGKEMLKAK